MAERQNVSNKDIYDAINDLRKEIRGEYATKDEFNPVRNIVFGLCSLVLVTVATVIITFFINTPPSQLINHLQIK